MFQSYQQGKQATLVPNPYWTPAEDTEARQLASKITITFHEDLNLVDHQLLSGSVDLDAAGTGVQETAQETILSSEPLRAQADAAPSNVLWLAYLDTKVAPLNNLACRQAIQYAANKDDLQAAFGGPYAGGIIASTLLLPGMPGYRAFGLYPAGDIADARKALSRCGYPRGFTIGAAFGSDQPKLVEAAQRLQGDLADVGIRLQLHGYPGEASYFSNIIGSPGYMQSHDLGVAFGNWEPDWPDGYSQLYPLVYGGNITQAGNTNVSQLRDPAIDALFPQANDPSLNAAQRNAIYGRIDAMAMSDAAIVPMVDGRNLLYRNPAVTNAYVEVPYGMYNYAVLGVNN
jgi:peptide/nickel transport system substrate-binding protein